MKTTRLFILLMAFLPAVQFCFAQDATALYNEGVQLKQQGNITGALEKLKQAVALKADYTEALYECGWCQNDLKNYYSAIDYLRQARVKWSNVPKVHFELGYAFEKTNSIDSALLSYNRCLELKPDYSLAFKQLGFIAYDKSSYVQALDYFKKYETFTKAEIKDYLYWYRKGFMCNAQKDYAGAKAALLKAADYKTDYINTYLELGYVSCRLKTEDEEAIGYYKKAIEVDPKNYIPYNGIGEVYRDNKKDMNEAMAWYSKALQVKPRERKAEFGMGYCLNSLGKYADAILYLKVAIEEEATYTAAYTELGYSHYMLQKYADALFYLNKAISLNPKNENAHYYSALVYIQQRDKTMAQKMVDVLKSLSSKYATDLQAKVNAI